MGAAGAASAHKSAAAELASAGRAFQATARSRLSAVEAAAADGAWADRPAVWFIACARCRRVQCQGQHGQPEGRQGGILRWRSGCCPSSGRPRAATALLPRPRCGDHLHRVPPGGQARRYRAGAGAEWPDCLRLGQREWEGAMPSPSVSRGQDYLRGLFGRWAAPLHCR